MLTSPSSSSSSFADGDGWQLSVFPTAFEASGSFVGTALGLDRVGVVRVAGRLIRNGRWLRRVDVPGGGCAVTALRTG